MGQRLPIPCCCQPFLDWSSCVVLSAAMMHATLYFFYRNQRHGIRGNSSKKVGSMHAHAPQYMKNCNHSKRASEVPAQQQARSKLARTIVKTREVWPETVEDYGMHHPRKHEQLTQHQTCKSSDTHMSGTVQAPQNLCHVHTGPGAKH